MMQRFTLATTISLAVLIGLFVIGSNLLRQKTAADLAARQKQKQDVSVTIIEGKRREEIAAQLAAAGVTGYTEFLAASSTAEGMLYPDTYRFFPNTPADEVVAKLKANYQARTAGLNLSREKLILASIIEREALHDADRPTIAGVYQNRLDIGMSLQADPTVQYGKDTNAYVKSKDPQSFVFWSEILRADYQGVSSPFNTYLAKGLPPAPICNPGKASIEAALNPAQHDYIFFGYKNEQLLLAKTLAQHEKQLLGE